ncbi:hypothetical protein NDU88_004304 [Pleurodeles waltl]|uniref:Uncharacterized protein n=1 Tax=Pleurodeles waltl TaxID=8319 RepID=A0AAV7PFC9_PLEWA|nr:hypothetical protein NDU88_004304 [Pleurodeles waltl]
MCFYCRSRVDVPARFATRFWAQPRPWRLHRSDTSGVAWGFIAGIAVLESEMEEAPLKHYPSMLRNGLIIEQKHDNLKKKRKKASVKFVSLV